LQILVACVFALFSNTFASADSFAFEDIRFWVGTGANRAALVIDWVENGAEPPALVWGYRWDGAATGARMLADVLTADDRLFAKLRGSAANPIALYGVGYDANDDGSFVLSDGTAFDAAGMAFTDPADAAFSLDSQDYYAEGWYTGFWHYGIASGNPFSGGAWTDTPVGMAGRTLSDGDWDSWTYSPTFNFASFAANPVAAASPYPAGDYDHNGRVESADFMHWKNLYGSTRDPSADGNYNGVVDSADYIVWRNHLGSAGAKTVVVGPTVPEPASLTMTIAGLIAMLWRRRSNNQR
jgi:hypothetical protein